MARGLVETMAWDTAQVVDYLLARPGIGPEWTRERLTGILDAAALN
jgi:hypothetical protein